MLKITYARTSKPGATEIVRALQAVGVEARLTQQVNGDINWGRYRAGTALNPDIRTSTDKLKMRELFKEHGVPTPKLFNLEEALDFLHAWNGNRAVIARPRHHARGSGMWFCYDEYQIQLAIEKGAVQFLEYLPDDQAPEEYRVHIFRGKSIRLVRKAFPGRNSCRGMFMGFYAQVPHEYTTEPVEGPKAWIREAAKQAAAATGLDFGAVDILGNPETKQAWVLEVNAAPGLGGTTSIAYAEAIKRWTEGEA